MGAGFSILTNPLRICLLNLTNLLRNPHRQQPGANRSNDSERRQRRGQPSRGSLSGDAFAALLAGGVQDEETPEETEEDDSEAEETEEVEETESDDDEEEEEAEEPEGLTAESIFKQLEGLDPEEIKALGKKLGSKALSRFGELTWKAKAAEEEALRIKSQQPEPAPIETVTSRFLEGVENVEVLASKVKELKTLNKDIERILDDHEEYGPSDPIQVGDQTYTKKALKALRKEVTEALTEAVPSKQAEFQQVAALEAATTKSEAEARAQVPELSEEESEVAKNFKTLTESPVFQKIAKLVPDARPLLPLLAAHAVRSIYGKGVKAVAKQATTGTTLKAKPPASPATVAAAPTTKTGSGNRRVADQAASRFEQSGSVSSFAQMLEARGV
jgi:hypothetical protein